MNQPRRDATGVQWIGAGGVGPCGLMVQGRTSRLLLDAGWDVGRKLTELVAPPDAIVVTHAHLDHCGAIAEALLAGTMPGVRSVESTPTVWATPGTKELLAPVLATKDSVGDRQAEAAARRVRAVQMGSWWHPTGSEDIRAVLLPAGHIAGAASVFVQSANDEGAAGVYYTGDLCTHDQPLTSGAQIPAWDNLGVDLMVTESILGDQTSLNELDFDRQWKRLIEVAGGADGGVLVATGSVGLSQEVLGALGGEVRRLVLHDGLGEITEAYWPDDGEMGTRQTSFRTESESVLQDLLRGNNVVVAPGAQCESGTPAGRLARRAAPRDDVTVILLRDCYRRHFGARLQRAERGESFDGKTDVRCDVETIRLPNHAPVRQLGDVATGLTPNEIWSVHGSDAARRALCDHLETVLPDVSASPVEAGETWEVAQ